MNPYLARFYSGELAAPIPRPAHGGLLGPSAAEFEGHVHEQRVQKLPALFAHFGIDPGAPDAWQRLALALAAEHVPGFGLQRPPMPSEWLPWSTPKRRRGRPRRLTEPAPGGLLGGPLAAGKPGRPPMRTTREKREAVGLFELAKVDGSSDIQVARRIAEANLPGKNRWNVEREAERIVRLVKRWRTEVRKLGEIPATFDE